MAVDPYPGGENETLEMRLRLLFNASVSTAEPEKSGLWYDAATKQLKIKIDGQTIKFNSVT